MTVLQNRKGLLDIFPAPEFLLLSNVGVVITDTDTKFIKLRKGVLGGGFKLAHLSKIDNPKGAVEFGLIHNPNEVAPILKRLAQHFDTRYVRVALPDDKAYLFTTTINHVSAQGLRDAVAFIIEENVPISLAEAIFDFEIIGDVTSDPSKIHLAVTVLSKNVVNSYIELFELAGITPISFDLESQAIARAVIGSNDNGSSLIINLYLDKTGFYVVSDGVVQFSTTLTYGVGRDDEYVSLNDMQTEMGKVFSFWEARTSESGSVEKKIEKIVLCGPGASKEDFVKKFMDGNVAPYTLADVWLNMTYAHDHVSEIPFNESLNHASVIGLVLPCRKKLYA